jgi:undecaprenyl-diphosphatase
MTNPIPVGPVEGRLADRLRARFGADGRVSGAVRLLRLLDRADRALYREVAGFSTPWLDDPMRRVSDVANFSKPWFVVAGSLAALGGPGGRRAAVSGIAAIGVTSLLVNQPMKLAGERPRPERARLGVPESRWVGMPSSASFPSGHSASAAAFCVSVGVLVPRLRWPLRAAATAVAFSRVYTGVHYPGDVLVGATVGAVIGRGTVAVVRRRHVRFLSA